MSYAPEIMLRPDGLMPYDAAYPVPKPYDQKKTNGAKPCRRSLNDPRQRAEIESLINDNLGLAGDGVKWMARLDRTSVDCMTYDEAFAEAVDGLMRAAQLYDGGHPAKGVKVTLTYAFGDVEVTAGGGLIKFSTYATWWIRQALYRGREHSRLVYDIIGTSRPKVIPEVYLTTFRKDRSKGGEDDYFAGQEPEDRREQPVDVMCREELREATHKLLRSIPHRYMQVLIHRFMDGMTLDEVGAKMGFTRERARQLENKGLLLLRKKAVRCDRIKRMWKETA